MDVLVKRLARYRWVVTPGRYEEGWEEEKGRTSKQSYQGMGV